MKKLLLLVFVLAAGCGVIRRPSPPPIQVPIDFQLQVYVKAGDAPLLEAEVYRDNAPDLISHVGPDGGAAWRLVGQDMNVCARSAGYETACVPAPLHQDLTLTINLVKTLEPPPPPPTPAVPWPPALARSQLPDFPPLTATQPAGQGVWSTGPYDKDMPFTVPDRPDLDFHRGNFSGVRATSCNLPLLPTGTDKDASHVMTWDLPAYPEDKQKCILKEYAIVRGYTHFLLSIPQARNQGVLDDRFLAAAQLAKDYHQFNVIVAMGGDGEDFDKDVAPILQILRDRQLLDEVVVCWQCDRPYDPWALYELTLKISAWAHARGVKVSLHWINEAAAWWNADDDPRRPNTCLDAGICNRFDYHRVMGGKVDYQYLQVDVDAPINDATNGGLQGSVGDVLRSFTTEKLVVAEYDAQGEFDDPKVRTEDQGDLKGYLLMCSRRNGAFVLGGYMNGSRLPNGRVQ